MRYALLFSATALLSPVVARCPENTLDQIVSLLECGDALTVAACLTQTNEPTAPCLQSLGCQQEQVDAVVSWVQDDCNLDKHPDLTKIRLGNAAKPVELRKRQTAAATAQATEAATEKTAAVATTAAAATSTATDLVCLTTTTSSYSYCLTTSGSATCTTALTSWAKCADGLMCATATANAAVTCMKIDNSLTTSGLVVTIILSVVLAGLLGSLLFMCFSSRKASTAARRKRESMFIATKMEESDADTPLMSSAGPPAFGGAGYVHGQGNGVAGPRAENPKLHPGIIGTPVNEEDIAYHSPERR